MTQEQRRIWLIRYMQKQMEEYADYAIPRDEAGQWALLRAQFNVRPPMPASDEFFRIEGELLKGMARDKGITEANDLPASPRDTRLSVWQGDITALRVDAIVNAANSQMLGCWVPGHSCIDNAIHTFAGVELRCRCYELMQAQGHEEPTGQAKITPAYNLPSRYILHTVGPIVTGEVTCEDRDLLASCYTSCLDLAEENDCFSVAFCCISTGVFMFPAEEAARIAVDTVRKWLDAHPKGCVQKVIFNVFKDSDLAIYNALLG